MLMLASVSKKEMLNIFDKGIFTYILLNSNPGFKKFWGIKNVHVYKSVNIFF